MGLVNFCFVSGVYVAFCVFKLNLCQMLFWHMRSTASLSMNAKTVDTNQKRIPKACTLNSRIKRNNQGCRPMMSAACEI